MHGGKPLRITIIVDAWAVTIDGYTDLLQRLDVMKKPWVQMVVPWKRGDAESEADKEKLWSALDSALGQKLARSSTTELPGA
jgi:FxsC-like protein